MYLLECLASALRTSCGQEPIKHKAQLIFLRKVTALGLLDATEKTQVLYIHHTSFFVYLFYVVCCLPLLCCLLCCFVPGVGGDNRSTTGCHTNHVWCEYWYSFSRLLIFVSSMHSRLLFN